MSKEMTVMTEQQLQQLIEAVRISATNAATSASAAVGANSNLRADGRLKGSFSTCTTRFGGQRDHEAVEEFITSIETFKDLESISDEDALKGISLLLYGIASTWWQGVRKEAKTWKDCISLIREHFSPVKPPYQIYVEIFEKKQSDQTPIDLFVVQKRALLAQLPDGRHDEESEIDLVYGLLNIKYRKHISRDEIGSFKELLDKGRIIELNNMEAEAAAQRSGHVKGAKGTRRCTYCNFRGHTTDQCRKRRKADAADDASNADDM